MNSAKNMHRGTGRLDADHLVTATLPTGERFIYGATEIKAALALVGALTAIRATEITYRRWEHGAYLYVVG